MPRQIREILASVRETGDRGRNTGAPGKYGRSGNPILTSPRAQFKLHGDAIVRVEWRHHSAVAPSVVQTL